MSHIKHFFHHGMVDITFIEWVGLGFIPSFLLRTVNNIMPNVLAFVTLNETKVLISCVVMMILAIVVPIDVTIVIIVLVFSITSVASTIMSMTMMVLAITNMIVQLLLSRS